MKRINLLFITMLIAGTTRAQLRVDSLGCVEIEKSMGVSGKVSISNNNAVIDLRIDAGAPNTTKRSIYSTLEHNAGKQSYNIYCQQTNNIVGSDTGRSIGIFSQITHPSPGTTASTPYCYAICGLNRNNGAAIFGTSGSTSLVSLSQPYAGYFIGNTHVQGNLTVSGNINGVILSPTSNPSSPFSTEPTPLSTDRNTLSSKFQGMTACSFYYGRPQSPEPPASIRKEGTEVSKEDVGVEDSLDFEEEETITEAELPLNAIGKQVYAKQHYSLSADELEEVFPDLVYENEDGSKSINYVEMVPILVQAIGELSAKVAALEGSDGKKSAKTTNTDEIDENVQVLSLGQNKPNPFGTSTEIEICVPESVQNAFVYVYDLQGKKVQQVDITARGKQTIHLNAADLSDGMYLYSLIADGKVVETKRMIVEK